MNYFPIPLKFILTFGFTDDESRVIQYDYVPFFRASELSPSGAQVVLL